MRVDATVVIATIAVAARVAQAQPVDRARATELYRSGEAAMTDGRWADALRDYGAAYELSRDPVLFYKIGAAHEKAGKCEVALIYYRRYLKEAKPAPKFVEQTTARIKACHGEVEPPAPVPVPVLKPPESPTPTPTPTPTPGPAAPTPTTHGSRAAWLMVGGAVTFATIGAVLAYAARSSEADLSDLYVGIGGKTPTYDPATAQRYADLVDQGKRYEHLSWAGFGLAGATAITATILFARGTPTEDRVLVVPTASPTGAGVTAVLRF